MSTVFLEEHDIKHDVIITGEAVELEIKPASILVRVGAAFVDGCFSLHLLLISIFLVADSIKQIFPTKIAANTAGEVIGRVLLILVVIMLPSIIEALTRGRSLGKLLSRTRVVRDDGGIISARQAFIRGIVWLIEGWLTLGAVAFVTALLSRRGKRLGDMAAGTYVASVSSRPHRLSLEMPPGLEQWAQYATFAPIPQNLSNKCNNFLRQEKSHYQNPNHAGAGLSLAAELYGYVSPPPPQGTPPEHFIAAVLVARRNLEYQTASRRQKRIDQARKRAHAFRYGVGASPQAESTS